MKIIISIPFPGRKIVSGFLCMLLLTGITGLSAGCRSSGETQDSDNGIEIPVEKQESVSPPVEPQKWSLVEETGQEAILTVNEDGSFTGSGWTGSTPSSSYSIPITEGKMSGTAMSFTADAEYDGGDGRIRGKGQGNLDTAFPDAVKASGILSGTISDPLGTREFSIKWTASRLTGGISPGITTVEEFDFDVNIPEHIITLKQGEATDIPVDVELVRGKPQQVMLSVTDWETAYIRAFIDPNIVNPTAGTSLTVQTTCATPAGEYLFTVTGTTQGTFRSSADAVTIVVESNPDCTGSGGTGTIPGKPASFLGTDTEYNRVYMLFQSWGYDFNALYEQYSQMAVTEGWDWFWIGSEDDTSRRATFDSIGTGWLIREIP